MTDSVTVEQCDREAAAECFDFIDLEEQADAIARVAPIFARHQIASEQRGYDRAIAEVVAWLRAQSDAGAEWALQKDKGTTGRAAYGGGSYALKKASDAIEAGEHKP